MMTATLVSFNDKDERDTKMVTICVWNTLYARQENVL